MTANELRQIFLDFFKGKGHKVIPPASLIPENDPTALFTSAGMHPLVPYLLGEKHPAGQRLVNFQKCLRTGDIDEVGDNWHLTFFEMLGNWSLGDPSSPDGIGKGYFKKEAIEWSLEFLTNKKWLNISVNKLAVSVFKGDKDAPFDEETYNLWQALGIPENRIFKFGKEDNWWGPVGESGPCGPCTEIFYDTDAKQCSSKCSPSCHCGKYAEIWNDVFMEYFKVKGGGYEPLIQKNIDTGMGLERTLATLVGKNNVYEIELFAPLIKKIEELSKKNYSKVSETRRLMRIIADHMRAAVFILGDEKGITPSNIDQGYVLRRLVRRAVRFGKLLGIENIFTFKIAEEVLKIYQDIYPELRGNKDFIIEQLIREEEKFAKTLGKGIKIFNKLSKNKTVSGEQAFLLFSTYGFPFEMTQELGREKGIKVDKKEFLKEAEKHQKLSRVGAEKKFKGGLADMGQRVIKLHTAAHLLLAALREVLGKEIYQRGSNITAERLRFDFNWPKKLAEEEIKKIENLVNQKITEDIAVEAMEMSKKKALKSVKISFDSSKYGEIVKVYKIGNFSVELCGGPHIKHTGELGVFKIIKEEASSAGIRRIKATIA